MGDKEDRLLHDALHYIKSLDFDIRCAFKEILSEVHKSNAFMCYKRRVYRIVRNVSSLGLMQKEKKTLTIVEYLREVEFLLPDAFYKNSASLRLILHILEYNNTEEAWKCFYRLNPHITPELVASVAEKFKNNVLLPKSFKPNSDGSAMKSQAIDLKPRDYEH